MDEEMKDNLYLVFLHKHESYSEISSMVAFLLLGFVKFSAGKLSLLDRA